MYQFTLLNFLYALKDSNNVAKSTILRDLIHKCSCHAHAIFGCSDRRKRLILLTTLQFQECIADSSTMKI